MARKPITSNVKPKASNTPDPEPAPSPQPAPIPDIADSPIVKGDNSLGAKVAALTPKQRKLVSLLCLSGIPKSEAYRQAYNTKQTGKQLASQACDVASRPRVASVVNAYNQLQWAGVISDGPSIRQTSLSVMRDLALHGKAERTKLSAAVALGKTNIAGLYSGPATVHQHLHIGDSSARDILLEKMTKLFGAPQVIDSTVLVSTSEMPFDGTAQADDVIEGQVIEAEPVDELDPSDPDSDGPPAGPGTPPCE